RNVRERRSTSIEDEHRSKRRVAKFALALSLLRSKLHQTSLLRRQISRLRRFRWKRKVPLLLSHLSLSTKISNPFCVIEPRSESKRFSDSEKISRKLKFQMHRSAICSRKVHRANLNADDEIEQLRASVDFLVELCDTVSNVEKSSFTNWAHQAVDFILASLKNLLSTGKNMELIEGIVSSLIMRLVRRMCSRLKLDDPFDDAFTNMHECMFTLIQIIEFLISDYLLMWSRDEGFDQMLFEEWVASVLHARKALELLESRNGLYVLYIDRVTGELSKQVSQSSSLQKLKPEILDNLFQ
ncbi:protein multipolar spindle 1, partial [Quercus suber]